MEQISREVVLGYLHDLREVLDRGSVAEQRAFLRSFIKAIEKHDSQVIIHYTLPLPPERVPESPLGVLDIDSYGGAEGKKDRTFSLTFTLTSQVWGPDLPDELLLFMAFWKVHSSRNVDDHRLVGYGHNQSGMVAK